MCSLLKQDKSQKEMGEGIDGGVCQGMDFVVYCNHADAWCPFCLSEKQTETLERIQRWVETEVAQALAKSDWLQIEIHVKGGAVTPDLTIKYPRID